MIFEIMNYLFLNTNFALKLQAKYSKDDVVTFTAHLSVTIKRLTRYKQKVVSAAMLEGKSIPSNMAANAIHTTFLKNQRTIKYLPSMRFPRALPPSGGALSPQGSPPFGRST